MNTPLKIIAWINCYGAWAPDLRHPVETIGYDQYLEGATNALVALNEHIKAIYVSGGMIDQVGRTECETTVPEILRRLNRKGVHDTVAKKYGYHLPPINQTLIPLPRLDNHPNSTPEKQAEILKSMQEKGIDEVERSILEARRNKRL